MRGFHPHPCHDFLWVIHVVTAKFYTLQIWQYLFVYLQCCCIKMALERSAIKNVSEKEREKSTVLCMYTSGYLSFCMIKKIGWNPETFVIKVVWRDVKEMNFGPDRLKTIYVPLINPQWTTLGWMCVLRLAKTSWQATVFSNNLEYIFIQSNIVFYDMSSVFPPKTGIVQNLWIKIWNYSV